MVVVFGEGSQGLFFLVSQFGYSESIVPLVMNYGQLQLKKKKKEILWLRMNRKMNMQSFSYCLIIYAMQLFRLQRDWMELLN